MRSRRRSRKRQLLPVETVRTSLDNRSLTNTGSERQLLPVETVRASVDNRLSDLNSSVHYGILPFYSMIS